MLPKAEHTQGGAEKRGREADGGLERRGEELSRGEGSWCISERRGQDRIGENRCWCREERRGIAEIRGEVLPRGEQRGKKIGCCHEERIGRVLTGRDER